MTKSDLNKVVSKLTLPAGWKVQKVLTKDSKGSIGKHPTDYIIVHFNDLPDSSYTKTKESALSVVKQLNKLTAKTADGVWDWCDAGYDRSGIKHIVNFYIDFTYVRRRLGSVCGMKAIPLGKKIRSDKFLTKAQVKREMNKLFDDGKIESVVELIRRSKVGRISQVALEEIHYIAECEK
mgnify:CR=1 FL=1